MRNVIIDCDPGVDDALALLTLSDCKDIDIKLISVASGNVDINQTTKNVLYILDKLNLDISVVVGKDRPLEKEPMYEKSVHGNFGLGNIVPETKRYPSNLSLLDAYENVLNTCDDVELICLAPLTNIATIQLEKPNLLKKFKRITIMGGSINGNGNITDFSEFNFYADPKAVEVILSSNVPFVLSPIEIGWECEVDKNITNNFKNTDRENFVKDLIDGSFDRHGNGTFAVHDANTAMLLINPSLYDLKRCDIDFISVGEFAGRCSVKFNDNGNYFVQLLKEDKEKIKEILIKSFCGE